jgi:hypothetical protein
MLLAVLLLVVDFAKLMLFLSTVLAYHFNDSYLLGLLDRFGFQMKLAE